MKVLYLFTWCDMEAPRRLDGAPACGLHVLAVPAWLLFFVPLFPLGENGELCFVLGPRATN